jgi:hypothetical protein
MTKLTWLKVGATWTEILRDMNAQRPVESFVTYRVTSVPDPGSDGSAEIERKTRTQDDEDTSTYSPEDLISEGTLLDQDPEQSECVDMNDGSFFVERTESVPVDIGARNCYKLIRKVRGECPRCSGSGECPDCSNSGECPTCGGNAQCSNCGGEGKCTECSGEGKCYSCDGLGKCSSCEGKGRYDSDGGPGEKCDSCQGTGRCENCAGSGLCTSCKGSKRCLQCNGTGKCGDCQGSSKCPYCNGSLKCRECQGVQTAKMIDEMWFDMATGVLLKATKTVNKRVVLERKVTAMSVAAGPMPTLAVRSSGREDGLSSPSSHYTPPQPVPGRPLQIPDVCPGCGRSLKSVGTPVFCPFCNTRLLQ